MFLKFAQFRKTKKPVQPIIQIIVNGLNSQAKVIFEKLPLPKSQ